MKKKKGINCFYAKKPNYLFFNFIKNSDSEKKLLKNYISKYKRCINEKSYF